MSGQLKEVRERISSVNSTQQITKAMKMVSAAKLRKAQQAITKMRPYAERLKKIMTNILSNLEGDATTTFGKSREIQRICIVIITSNRGLAGAFNANLGKKTLEIIAKYPDYQKDGQIEILFVGKKGFDFLKSRSPGCTYNREYQDLFSDLSFDNVSLLADHLMEQFLEGKYDVVHVVYGKFKNAAVQYAESVQYLPVERIKAKKEKGKKYMRADYIFEPDKVHLLETLIPSILQTTFHRYILDTHASEHGARMTAMDKATENAEELMKELKINYNKARQAAITNEISEIVGGAAALEG